MYRIIAKTIISKNGPKWGLTGVSYLTIIKHAGAATSTGADVYAWQETDVPNELQEVARERTAQLSYTLHLGRYTADQDGADANFYSKRRVGIAVRSGTPAYSLCHHHADTLGLLQSGRWTERAIPINDGQSFIVVASIYGYSGASSDPSLARTNEGLLKAALHRASTFLATPYYLCGDINIDPSASLWRTSRTCKWYVTQGTA